MRGKGEAGTGDGEEGWGMAAVGQGHCQVLGAGLGVLAGLPKALWLLFAEIRRCGRWRLCRARLSASPLPSPAVVHRSGNHTFPQMCSPANGIM